MIPERMRLLWELMDAHAEYMKSLKEAESYCGDGPIGKKAKALLKETRDKARRHLYATLYGCEPPADLPDNWETK